MLYHHWEWTSESLGCRREGDHFCQWINSLCQRHGTEKNLGFWCQTLENAALVDNKKNFTGSLTCVYLSAMITLSLTRLRHLFESDAGSLTDTLVVLMFPTDTPVDCRHTDSTVTQDLFVCVEKKVWDPPKLQECSLNLLCVFHTLSLTTALRDALGFISYTYCRYERVEVGLCSIIQQCSVRKSSWTELRLYILVLSGGKFIKYSQCICIDKKKALSCSAEAYLHRGIKTNHLPSIVFSFFILKKTSGLIRSCLYVSEISLLLFFSCPLSCSSALLFLPRFNEVSSLTFSSGCLVRFSMMLTGFFISLSFFEHFWLAFLNKSIQQQHHFAGV